MEHTDATCPASGRSHAYGPWCWRVDTGRYHRECSLMGCDFSETATQLTPIGRTMLVGEPRCAAHDWTVWRSLDDQFGLYEPPWLYRRECGTCGLRELSDPNLVCEADRAPTR